MINAMSNWQLYIAKKPLLTLSRVRYRYKECFWFSLHNKSKITRKKCSWLSLHSNNSKGVWWDLMTLCAALSQNIRYFTCYQACRILSSSASGTIVAMSTFVLNTARPTYFDETQCFCFFYWSIGSTLSCFFLHRI